MEQLSVTPSASVWENWYNRWHEIFAGLLVFCLLIDLVETDERRTTFVFTFALAGALAIWSLLVNTTRRRTRQEYSSKLVVYFLAGWLIWYFLVQTDPVFFLMLFGLFPYAFIVMPLSRAIALAGALNILVLIQLHQIDNTFTSTWMIVLCLTLAIGSLIAHFIHTIIQESNERRHLIEQLEKTRHDLAIIQHRAGVLAERERIARELHDTVIQGLIGIITNLEAAENTADHAESLPDYLDQAKTLARENLKEARAFLREMQPDVLKDRALSDAVRYVLDTWFTISPINAELEVTGIPLLPSQQIELTILRVLQEGLANIVRHASASRVKVTLSYMQDEITVDIHDNGKGFNPGARSGSSFGLTGMRQRVEQMGGTLIVESEPGVGTTLMVTLPVLTPNGGGKHS